MEIAHIYVEGSGIDEMLEPTAETETGSSGSRDIIGGNEQGLPDTEPSVAEPIGRSKVSAKMKNQKKVTLS